MTANDPRFTSSLGMPGAGRLPLGPQFVEQLPPKSNTVMTVVTIVIMCIALVATLVIMLLALFQSNVPLLAVSLVLALVTLTFVWLVVWFIDRWEPEPKLLLFGAVAWGAGIATAATLIAGTIGGLLFPGRPEWWGAVIDAPVFEEFFKGLGVLIIFFVARKHFNGPTDGIVFGALSGAGFAFTENILYFSSQAAAGFESDAASGVVALGYQFVVRGVALPLLHPICTSLTGAAIGWGARRGGAGPAIGGFFVGLIPAMLVHAIWNGGTTLAAASASSAVDAIGNTLLLFVFVMVPIFVAWIVMVVLFRRSDRKLVRERLGEYASVGWYSPAEVQMLSSMQGRSGARSWAKRLGPTAVRAMRDFIEDSTRLAHTRHQVLLDPQNAAKRRHEHELLSDLTRIRRVLSHSQRAGAHQMASAVNVAPPAHLPPSMPQPYQHAYGRPTPAQPMQPEWGRSQQPGQVQQPGQWRPGPAQQPGQWRPGPAQQPGYGQPGQAQQPGQWQPGQGQEGGQQPPRQPGQQSPNDPFGDWRR